VRAPRVVCCDRPALKEVGKHAKILSVPAEGCEHRHVMRQLIPALNLSDVYPCSGFDSCIQNELISLKERHIQEVPNMTREGLLIWYEAFELLRKAYPPRTVHQLSREECIKQAPQSRRKRMATAFDNLDHSGWSDKYASGKAFGKWEKFDDSARDLEYKAMRMIQHRSDEYCYELARYLKPIERAVLYKRTPRRRRLFAKGMTPHQKGERINLMDRWSSTTWCLLDHSRYDAHLVNPIRDLAREYFMEFYPGNKKLEHLLDLQRKNKFRTRNGIRYQMNGTMCSGDYNTSLEDNIINLAIILYATRNIEADILVDGDDSVVSFSSLQAKAFDCESFAKAALTTKIQFVHSIYDVDFCQMHPIQTREGWTMVRDPVRVLSRSAYTDKTYNGYRDYLGLVKAVGLCEIASNRGIPVLQSWGKLLERSGLQARAHRNELEELLRYRRVSARFDSVEVSFSSRLDFSLAFGISTTEQVEIEDFLDSIPALPIMATLVCSQEGGAEFPL